MTQYTGTVHSDLCILLHLLKASSNSLINCAAEAALPPQAQVTNPGCMPTAHPP